MMPALEVLRPIPAIAWVPIAVMLWPSNEGSIIFITFLGAFYFMVDDIAGEKERRSLEALWSTVHSLPAEDQGERFADDYQAREEIRAAAEAWELARARLGGRGGAPTGSFPGS